LEAVTETMLLMSSGSGRVFCRGCFAER
jgi:hypothetical protein